MLAKRKEVSLGALGARKNTQPNLNTTATKDVAEENKCGDIKETAMIEGGGALNRRWPRQRSGISRGRTQTSWQ